LALFAQTVTTFFAKKFIITSVFEKNAKFFAQKLAKIAENCDYNLDCPIFRLNFRRRFAAKFHRKKTISVGKGN
jgi:hypothetical protein